jgi:hypothetical protein
MFRPISQLKTTVTMMIQKYTRTASEMTRSRVSIKARPFPAGIVSRVGSM